MRRFVSTGVQALIPSTVLPCQNGLGIEHGLYESTRSINATILSSVCHISTK
jgi:hypothetical protein